MKACNDCGESKPHAEFYMRGKYVGPYCKPCHNVRVRNTRAKNPEHYRNYRSPTSTDKTYRRNVVLRSKYGITQDDFEKMLLSQDSKCAICGAAEPGGRGTWHVDHDHETVAVRGLLCWRCHSTLGKAGDSVELLQSMIDYLEFGNVFHEGDYS